MIFPHALFAYETLLQLIILLPLLAVVGIVACAGRPNLRESVSLLTSLTVFLMACTLYSPVMRGEIIETTWFAWFPGLDVRFRLEPLGLLFSLIAGFLWFVTTLYALGYMRAHNEPRQTRFYSCFALAITATMGIACAENLLTLFIFYEALTLCTFPLVTHAGTERAKHGGWVYISILLGTSIAFFLLAIALTWQLSGTLSFTPGGVFTADTSTATLSVLLTLFVFGVGKAAIMPFHRWLPAAMVAPTPVSALLHAVAVVKAGVFTLLKVCFYIFGLETLNTLPALQWLLYLAGATILLASLVALRQDNLKARLAYSTVSQLGYITLGALLATSVSLMGSAMHIAMHAFGKITLFFCAGAILVAAHKTEISEMRGLGRQMPLTMLAFLVGSLSIIGIPPTGGTWSKWYLLSGTFDAGQWLLMGVLMISSLLNIAYLLPIGARAFFAADANPPEIAHRPKAVAEAPLPVLMATGITALGCVVLFVYPQPIYRLISTAF